MKKRITLPAIGALSLLIGVSFFYGSAAVAQASGLASGAWPAVHHNAQNTSRSDDLNGPTGPSPQIVWQYRNSFGRTGVTVGEDLAGVVGVYSGDGRQPITRLDPASGAVVWNSSPGIFEGQADKSTPTLGANGRVYMGERGNNMIVADMANGDVVLKKKIRHDGDIRTSPLILSDGCIIYCSGALGNGWCKSLKPDAENTPEDPYYWSTALKGSILNVAPALSIDETVAYISLDRQKVVAINAATKAELWRVTPSRRGRGGSVADHSPVVGPDDTIYFGSRDGIFALDPTTGQTMWQWSTQGRESIASNPALGLDGRLYVGVSGRPSFVVAIAPPATCLEANWPCEAETSWRYDMADKGTFTNNGGAIDAAGRFYVTYRKKLMAFDANGIDHDASTSTPDQGQLIWQMPFPRNFKNPVTIGGEGVLYVVNGKAIFKVTD
jgi:outer membrane protein assembly factor BamB